MVSGTGASRSASAHAGQFERPTFWLVPRQIGSNRRLAQQKKAASQEA
jgi:hypothetical protein